MKNQTVPAILQGRFDLSSPEVRIALKELEKKKRQKNVKRPWDRITPRELVEGLGGKWPSAL